jgi:hypothetical protein
MVPHSHSFSGLMVHAASINGKATRHVSNGQWFLKNIIPLPPQAQNKTIMKNAIGE